MFSAVTAFVVRTVSYPVTKVVAVTAVAVGGYWAVSRIQDSSYERRAASRRRTMRLQAKLRKQAVARKRKRLTSSRRLRLVSGR